MDKKLKENNKTSLKTKRGTIKGSKWLFLFQLFVFSFLILSTISVSAQKDSLNTVSISTSVDLYSRYIWRGQEYGQSPSIQPDLSLSWKDFSFGTWGAYKLTGEGIQETDFYLSKIIGPATLAVWDYYSFYDTSSIDFFNYKKGNTSHLLEAQVLLEGNEKIPFNLLGSYFFYGADPLKSIYLELQYFFNIDQTEIQLFAGYQIKGTYYASKPAFVNIGCTASKNIEVTKEWSLPLILSLIANPDQNSVYLIAGITL